MKNDISMQMEFCGRRVVDCAAVTADPTTSRVNGNPKATVPAPTPLWRPAPRRVLLCVLCVSILGPIFAARAEGPATGARKWGQSENFGATDRHFSGAIINIRPLSRGAELRVGNEPSIPDLLLRFLFYAPVVLFCGLLLWDGCARRRRLAVAMRLASRRRNRPGRALPPTPVKLPAPVASHFAPEKVVSASWRESRDSAAIALNLAVDIV